MLLFCLFVFAFVPMVSIISLVFCAQRNNRYHLNRSKKKRKLILVLTLFSFSSYFFLLHFFLLWTFPLLQFVHKDSSSYVLFYQQFKPNNRTVLSKLLVWFKSNKPNQMHDLNGRCGSTFWWQNLPGL